MQATPEFDEPVAAPGDDSLPDPFDVERSGPERRCERGDLWRLGDHYLLIGDCTEQADVSRVFFEDGAARLLIADPPYGVDYARMKSYLARPSQLASTRRMKTLANDQPEDVAEMFRLFLELAPLCPYNQIYVFCQGSEIHTLRHAFDAAGLKWSDILIWVKNCHVPGRRDYKSRRELIAYGWRGRHRWYGGFETNVLSFPRVAKCDLHPTMKPAPLIQHLIKNGSAPGEVVYDPFGGSGTTLIACEAEGRRCRMIEIEPTYGDVILARWEEMTGGKAAKVG